MTTATYLYQDGSLLRAQDQAVKALELDPENRPMRRMVGWIRLRMGTTEDLLMAERFFEDLYADGDKDAPVLLGLATAEERLGVAHDEAARAIASGERFTESPDPEKRSAELFDDEDLKLFLEGNNLTDVKAREHASFLKEIAPLPGRNLRMGVGYRF